MNNIKILDCTLRDGGRIIDCEFPTSQSKRIIYSLQQANIDIIEVGFLRDEKIVKSRDNTTFFTSINQMVPLLPKERKSMFVAFVDFGMFSLETLEQNDGVSIDGIRFGFTKKDFIDFVETDGYFKVECFAGSNFYPFPPKVSHVLASLFPSQAVSIFWGIRRTEKGDCFIKVLDSRFYETPYYRGSDERYEG